MVGKQESDNGLLTAGLLIICSGRSRPRQFPWRFSQGWRRHPEFWRYWDGQDRPGFAVRGALLAQPPGDIDRRRERRLARRIRKFQGQPIVAQRNSDACMLQRVAAEHLNGRRGLCGRNTGVRQAGQDQHTKLLHGDTPSSGECYLGLWQRQNKSCVKVGKQRTFSSARSAGTATYISVAPISIPAASARITGSIVLWVAPFFLLSLRLMHTPFPQPDNGPIRATRVLF
jgi:hypothetical protein